MNIPEDAIQMHRLELNGTAVEETKNIKNSGIGEGGHSDITSEVRMDPETRSAEEAQEYPTGSKFWLIILTLSALLILGGLDTNIVATAVPTYVLQKLISCPGRT